MFDIKELPVNMLQMLSSKENPDPWQEVDWHCKQWEQTAEPTYIATVRPVKGLIEQVAYYGDSKMNNVLLATGKYYGYLDKSTPRGENISSSGIYRDFGLPRHVVGFVGVTDLQKTEHRQSIRDLKGRMRSHLEKIVAECCDLANRLEIMTLYDLMTEVKSNEELYKRPIRQLGGKSIKDLYDGSLLDRKNLPNSAARMIVFYYRLSDLGERE
jgi:hypothetical protein